MGLLKRGANFLNRVLPTAAGPTQADGTAGTLTYTRGATSAAVSGWAGQEERDATDAPTPEARSTDRERDYLIPVAELTAFGVPTEGDTVTETINGVAVVFRVSKQETEPEWRYADHARTRYRIHTRKK